MKNRRFLLLIISFLILTSCLFTNCKDREGIIKGRVISEIQKGLKDVIISDGVNFALTNKEGRYEIEINDSSRFVFIVTPKDYIADYSSGVPAFYQRITKDKKVYDFILKALSNGLKGNNAIQKISLNNNSISADPVSDDSLNKNSSGDDSLSNNSSNDDSVALSSEVSLVATADIHLKTMNHLNNFVSHVIPDMQKTADKKMRSGRAVIGISLGDIVWDKYKLYPQYVESMKLLSFPNYGVIGNHDHMMSRNTDRSSIVDYEKYFGPNYYAFHVGNALCVVLDNILYKGKRSYKEDIDSLQIDWFSRLMKLIPKGSNVIIATHSPFLFQTGTRLKCTDTILNILKPFKSTFISGHMHLNSNEELAPNVMQHNIAAICGTWWLSHINRDGTPWGYEVFDISDSITSYYKCIGKDENYQFEVYKIGSDKKNPKSFVAKVWNWDKYWKVLWYEDGIYMGEMTRFNMKDTHYSVKHGRLTLHASTAKFFFKAIPHNKNSVIEVEVKDGRGIIYPRQKVN